MFACIGGVKWLSVDVQRMYIVCGKLTRVGGTPWNPNRNYPFHFVWEQLTTLIDS